jgi:hypothetical protein
MRPKPEIAILTAMTCSIQALDGISTGGRGIRRPVLR